MQRPTSNQLTVVGLDPGYGKFGVAVLTGRGGQVSWRDSTCLTTDNKLALPDRLQIIGQNLELIFAEIKPQIIALERLFFSRNQKTALVVSEARGLGIYLGKKTGATILEYTPAQIKQTVTGYGRSDKRQIMTIIPRLLKIEKTIKEDDEYDAIAVALTAFAHYPQFQSQSGVCKNTRS